MRPARVPRAQSSLITSGIVFRPRTLSPATSGKSCACIVVVTMAAVTAIQQIKTGLLPTSLLPNKVVIAPQPKQARATAFKMLRCTGPVSPHPRSLYSHTSVVKVTLGSKLCSATLMQRHTGMRVLRICWASSPDSRPEGMGRQGLLIMSSAIASGSLWLEISSIRRFIHSQNTINGIRLNVCHRLNSCAVSTRHALEKTTEIAKMDCGTTIDLRSPLVKRYRVPRLYHVLRRLVYSFHQ